MTGIGENWFTVHEQQKQFCVKLIGLLENIGKFYNRFKNKKKHQNLKLHKFITLINLLFLNLQVDFLDEIGQSGFSLNFQCLKWNCIWNAFFF